MQLNANSSIVLQSFFSCFNAIYLITVEEGVRRSSRILRSLFTPNPHARAGESLNRKHDLISFPSLDLAEELSINGMTGPFSLMLSYLFRWL